MDTLSVALTPPTMVAMTKLTLKLISLMPFNYRTMKIFSRVSQAENSAEDIVSLKVSNVSPNIKGSINVIEITDGVGTSYVKSVADMETYLLKKRSQSSSYRGVKSMHEIILINVHNCLAKWSGQVPSVKEKATGSSKTDNSVPSLHELFYVMSLMEIVGYFPLPHEWRLVGVPKKTAGTLIHARKPGKTAVLSSSQKSGSAGSAVYTPLSFMPWYTFSSRRGVLETRKPYLFTRSGAVIPAKKGRIQDYETTDVFNLFTPNTYKHAIIVPCAFPDIPPLQEFPGEPIVSKKKSPDDVTNGIFRKEESRVEESVNKKGAGAVVSTELDSGKGVSICYQSAGPRFMASAQEFLFEIATGMMRPHEVKVTNDVAQASPLALASAPAEPTVSAAAENIKFIASEPDVCCYYWRILFDFFNFRSADASASRAALSFYAKHQEALDSIFLIGDPAVSVGNARRTSFKVTNDPKMLLKVLETGLKKHLRSQNTFKEVALIEHINLDRIESNMINIISEGDGDPSRSFVEESVRGRALQVYFLVQFLKLDGIRNLLSVRRETLLSSKRKKGGRARSWLNALPQVKRLKFINNVQINVGNINRLASVLTRAPLALLPGVRPGDFVRILAMLALPVPGPLGFIAGQGEHSGYLSPLVSPTRRRNGGIRRSLRSEDGTYPYEPLRKQLCAALSLSFYNMETNGSSSPVDVGFRSSADGQPCAGLGNENYFSVLQTNVIPSLIGSVIPSLSTTATVADVLYDNAVSLKSAFRGNERILKFFASEAKRYTKRGIRDVENIWDYTYMGRSLTARAPGGSGAKTGGPSYAHSSLGILDRILAPFVIQGNKVHSGAAGKVGKKKSKKTKEKGARKLQKKTKNNNCKLRANNIKTGVKTHLAPQDRDAIIAFYMKYDPSIATKPTPVQKRMQEMLFVGIKDRIKREFGATAIENGAHALKFFTGSAPKTEDSVSASELAVLPSPVVVDALSGLLVTSVITNASSIADATYKVLLWKLQVIFNYYFNETAIKEEKYCFRQREMLNTTLANIVEASGRALGKQMELFVHFREVLVCDNNSTDTTKTNILNTLFFKTQEDSSVKINFEKEAARRSFSNKLCPAAMYFSKRYEAPRVIALMAFYPTLPRALCWLNSDFFFSHLCDIALENLNRYQIHESEEFGKYFVNITGFSISVINSLLLHLNSDTEVVRFIQATTEGKTHETNFRVLKKILLRELLVERAKKMSRKTSID